MSRTITLTQQQALADVAAEILCPGGNCALPDDPDGDGDDDDDESDDSPGDKLINCKVNYVAAEVMVRGNPVYTKSKLESGKVRTFTNFYTPEVHDVIEATDLKRATKDELKKELNYIEEVKTGKKEPYVWFAGRVKKTKDYKKLYLVVCLGGTVNPDLIEWVPKKRLQKLVYGSGALKEFESRSTPIAPDTESKEWRIFPYNPANPEEGRELYYLDQLERVAECYSGRLSKGNRATCQKFGNYVCSLNLTRLKKGTSDRIRDLAEKLELIDDAEGVPLRDVCELFQVSESAIKRAEEHEQKKQKLAALPGYVLGAPKRKARAKSGSLKALHMEREKRKREKTPAPAIAPTAALSPPKQKSGAVLGRGRKTPSIGFREAGKKKSLSLRTLHQASLKRLLAKRSRIVSPPVLKRSRSREEAAAVGKSRKAKIINLTSKSGRKIALNLRLLRLSAQRRAAKNR